MATSQTTNLQLTKYGAGTDNLLRSDFNDNMDKIDTFAGSTNTAIATVNLGSITVAQMQTALENMGNSMADNEHRYFRFYCSTASAPFGGGIAHIGELYKYTTNRYCAYVQGADSGARFITGVYGGSGWLWCIHNTPHKIVTSGIATAQTGFSIEEQRADIFDNYCFLKLRIKASSAISARSVVATIASDYRPTQTARAVCAAGSVYNSNLNGIVNAFIVNTNGYLYVDVLSGFTNCVEVIVNMSYNLS